MKTFTFSTTAGLQDSDLELIVRIITGENQRNNKGENTAKKIQKLTLVFQKTACSITKERAKSAVKILSTFPGRILLSKKNTHEIIKKLDIVQPSKK